MTDKDRLEVCRVCKNRTFDIDHGIVCSLTHKKAVFDKDCPDYVEDPKEIQIQALKIILRQKQKRQGLDENLWYVKLFARIARFFT